MIIHQFCYPGDPLVCNDPPTCHLFALLRIQRLLFLQVVFQMQRLLETSYGSDFGRPLKMKFSWEPSFWTKQISNLGTGSVKGDIRGFIKTGAKESGKVAPSVRQVPALIFGDPQTFILLGAAPPLLSFDNSPLCRLVGVSSGDACVSLLLLRVYTDRHRPLTSY